MMVVLRVLLVLQQASLFTLLHHQPAFLLTLTAFSFFFPLSVLLTFLALENEGLRDDCPQCMDSSGNRFQHAPPVPTVNQNQFQFQRTPQSNSRTVPQYRPIIAAYHPR